MSGGSKLPPWSGRGWWRRPEVVEVKARKGSFLKKRTKKLSSLGWVARGASGRPAQTKGFLLLFLQKKKALLSLQTPPLF